MGIMDSGFKATLSLYAQANQWKVDEIDDEHAFLEFVTESGGSRALEVFQAEDDMLVFVAPMSVGYGGEADMPHAFSTMLLRRNSELEIGYWCVEDIEDELAYSCVAEVPAEDLNEDTFGEIAWALASECDQMEARLESGQE